MMSYHNSKLTIAARVADLLSRMTLDEKIAQMGSCWVSELMDGDTFSDARMERLLSKGIGQITRLAGGSTLDPQACAYAANKLQHYLIHQTRLGIPAIIHEECCAGYTALGGTTFPQIIGLASTFEPALAEKMTSVIRQQMRAVGAHQGLAPVLDVARDARWGRCEETFGEDPTLVSRFGMAYVRGLQGNGLQDGIIATGKHFAGYSLPQGGQNCAPVHIGRQVLWDIYLMPFQAAIHRAGLHSIMNAYTELDGEVIAASSHILTELLRHEIGFDGLVVSDYDAIPMLQNYHRVAVDTSAAAALALTAGIDVELPTTTCYGEALKRAVQEGDISQEIINTAVARHLQKKFELGLFEQPYVDVGLVSDVFETHDQRQLAREIASKSLVLLKNQGILPLSKDIKALAVIGPNANDSRNLLGDYSYVAMHELTSLNPTPGAGIEQANASHATSYGIKIPTILEAICAKLPRTNVLYAKGCDNLGGDTSGFEAALQAAEQAEVVVLVLGDRAGLTPSCTSGETRDSADLCLPGLQPDLVKLIVSTGKPVVAVLINGRPLELNYLSQNVSAVLEAWLPGEEGAAAVADVLLGEVNPGGKLPMTFPRHVGQVPIYYNQKPSGGKSNWYIDYIELKASPLYPFGHGLSYTSFEYSDLSLNKSQARVDESVAISLKVKNTGPVVGDEVVQLYIQDEYACLSRPVKELKGFVRLALRPGESSIVTFNMNVNQLAFYDDNLDLVVEAGWIKVMLGSSSGDIRLESRFEIIGDKRSKIKERLFECPVEVEKYIPQPSPTQRS